MAKGGFEKAVAAWCKKAEQDALAIAKEAVHEAAEQARRNVPRDTGNYARGIVVSKTVPQVGGDREQFPVPDDYAEMAGYQLGDPLYIASRAVFTGKSEFGFISTSKDGVLRNIPGNHAITTAMSGWRGFVRRASTKRGRKMK